MWLGHFTLGNGAYRAQEEESLWLRNPREFSENSKLVLFQTKFVKEEEEEAEQRGMLEKM